MLWRKRGGKVNNSSILKDSVEKSVSSLLLKGFFSTAFQPIMQTTSKNAIGFESLIRGPKGTPLEQPGWLFNKNGSVSCKTLRKLDMLSIQSAVRNSRNLPGDSLIFINILYDTAMRITSRPKLLFALLDKLDILPNRLVFEISETTGKECTHKLAQSIKTFRKMGIRIALDDIGVRSPYLYHLLYLEPEFLKVDRLFIQGVDTDIRKQNLMFGMRFLAEKMDSKLIVEGIETVEELETMRKIGIDLAQGFFLGRPLPAENWQNAPVCNKNADDACKACHF
jgi:EAL domain-containing protein (putative c-di-GMP-specific phosphodiesterase class I)